MYKRRTKKIDIVLIVFLLMLIRISTLGQASNSQNYVMTNTVKQPGIVTEAMVNSLPIATQGKGQTLSYFDGLGRPMQNVITNGSATQHDLILGIEYDSMGREVIKYLPYSDIGNTATPGGYRPGWKSVQNSFYSSGTMTNVDASTVPFSVSVIEPSPLNRIAAQGAPGTTWQPNLSNPYDPASHSVQTKYLLNKKGDSIRYFTINAAGTISSSTFYDTNKINIQVTLDDQQQTTKEYTDLLGNVILKRILISGDSLQTYYIYDSMNLLRAVIQPEGTVVLKNNNWVFPTGFSSNWMFLYRYDERKRMVMKKAPGADSVNMVYDQWDRIVLTQDGNLQAGHFWLFTKYDQLNRAVITGQITDTRTLSALQTDATNSTGRFESVSTSATEGYTLNNTFPSSGSYTLTVYMTSHYDSYSNLPSWSSGYSFVNEYGITTQNNNLTGQVIATQMRILGTSNFNKTVSYYDDKYRVIQVTSDNAAGGKDRITKIFSFDGKVTSDYHNHTSRFYTTPLLTQETYSYDHVDRSLSLTHQTASQETVTISQNTYNEVGQTLNKKMHQSPSHPNALQKLDYSYNIRGWTNGINRPITSESGYEENDLFNLELHYANSLMPGANLQYNGNITEEILKNGYDEAETGNVYQYDQANRLKSSSWGKYSGSSWSQANGYNESGISYDRNGNILGLNRYMGSWNVIDSLKYQNYTGNQLGKVADLAPVNTTTTGFQDKDNGSGSDYTYDLNGNMKTDYNKSISSITYNFLNLPNIVTITGKGTITYTYDAKGNKLQKTTLDQTITPNKTTNYYYAGDYVYRNDTLEFMSHPEGRLRPVRIDTTQAITIANLKYIYDYFLKDHLGSTRSVLTTEQQTDIYAATMETANATKENALFNNVSSTAVTKPAGFSNDNNNQKASKLNGAVNISGNKRVGPSIILKVMTGDTISISTYGWYSGAVQPAATGVSAISTELIPLLTAGIAGQNGGKGGAVPSTFSDPFMAPDIASLLSRDSSNYVNTRPKAFLNWMVVGEDYVAATNSSNHVNAIQIPVCNAGDTLKQIVGPTNMVVRRNGWIYIYLSNESAQDVYFDNLVINLKHGPLVEQKEYYAFGMENTALATKAIKTNYFENRRKFNAGSELQSKEFLDGSGLELYDFNARTYDPQICRFLHIDALADYTPDYTPYAYVGNNPLLFCDPLGLDTVRVSGEGAHKIKIRDGDVLAFTIGKVTSYYTYDPGSKDAVGGFVGNGIQEGSLAPVSVFAKSGSKNENSSGYGETLGAALSYTEHKMFNNKNWFSLPMMKSYNPNFNGNGVTGGKIALAKKLSNTFKGLGWGLAVYNMYSIDHNKDFDPTQKKYNQGLNALGVVLPPIYSIALTTGNLAGEEISQNVWYRNNIRPLLQDATGQKRDPTYLNMEFTPPNQ
jgi:RHS repeat-associated protein